MNGLLVNKFQTVLQTDGSHNMLERSRPILPPLPTLGRIPSSNANSLQVLDREEIGSLFGHALDNKGSGGYIKANNKIKQNGFVDKS